MPDLPDRTGAGRPAVESPDAYEDSVDAFEASAAAMEALPANQTFVFRLYVAGSAARSQRAIANLKRLCERYLLGRFELEVIDLYQQPALAEGKQIVAIPTLIKSLPLPLRRFVGDLSDTHRVLVGLGLSDAASEDDGP